MDEERTPLAFQRKFVTADFMAQNYRISGEVNVRSRPLADALNDPSTDFLEIDNVYVSPILAPADIKANYNNGSLHKDNISMVILSREEDGLSTTASYGSYSGNFPRSVFLTVPGFEVRGTLEMSAQPDIRTYMVNAGRFIAISQGTATVSLRLEYVFEGGMILVHRQSIGIISLIEDEEG